MSSILVTQMVKNLPAVQEIRVRSLHCEDPLEKERLCGPVFLPGEFHRQKSLAGYSPWGCRVRHTERLILTDILVMAQPSFQPRNFFYHLQALVLHIWNVSGPASLPTEISLPFLCFHSQCLIPSLGLYYPFLVGWCQPLVSLSTILFPSSPLQTFRIITQSLLRNFEIVPHCLETKTLIPFLASEVLSGIPLAAFKIFPDIPIISHIQYTVELLIILQILLRFPASVAFISLVLKHFTLSLHIQILPVLQNLHKC